MHSLQLECGEVRTARSKGCRKERGRETIHSFVFKLKECGKRKDLQGGKLIHTNAREAGCDKNRYVASALVSMYSKCSRMQDARDVLESMAQHDVVSWNSLIHGYVENGESLVALDLFFYTMDCAPNFVTYVAALKACTKLDKRTCIEQGVRIHIQAREHGFDKEVVVANSLVGMYSRCGRMQHAQDVFDGMTERDVVSWNALIKGYVENEESLVGLDVFYRMDCAPGRVTFLVALKAAINLVTENKLEKRTCLEKGMAIHRQARERGFDKDVYVASILVDMYGKCGDMVQAKCIYDGMVVRSVVPWTALILGYVENGQSLVALEVFNNMDCAPNHITFVAALKACAALAAENKVEKKPCLKKGAEIHRQVRELGFDKDAFVASTLVDMYSKCGDMLNARLVFDGMTHRDFVSWNALILGYVENGDSSLALDVFERMDCVPNRVTFVAALKACVGLAMDKRICIEKGKSIHMQARECGFNRDVFVANTLVDMYSKCGDMLRAREVFDGITHRDLVSWNALLMGYVENGLSSIALDLFDNMECAPDSVTFVAALKACGSLGALETGQRIHNRVRELGYEQELMVANCLVDFYGKCGNVAAAEEVFYRMHSRSVVSWTALIGGYSLVGNTSGVFDLVKRMQDSGMQMDGVTMVLILTACSHAGMVEEGQSYFDSMSRYGISPSVEHYACMVDMLGRANRLEEALSLICGMPFEANGYVWMTLLGACWKWSNKEIGKVAFHALVSRKNREDIVAACVLMRNIYERLGMREEVEQIEHKWKLVKTWRKPRQTRWSDAKGKAIYSFVVGDEIKVEVTHKLKTLLS